MKNEREEVVESFGKLIGYLHALPFSIPGLLLILGGIMVGSMVVEGEINAKLPRPGTGIFAAGLLIAGALLHASKSMRN